MMIDATHEPRRSKLNRRNVSQYWASIGFVRTKSRVPFLTWSLRWNISNVIVSIVASTSMTTPVRRSTSPFVQPAIWSVLRKMTSVRSQKKTVQIMFLKIFAMKLARNSISLANDVERNAL